MKQKSTTERRKILKIYMETRQHATKKNHWLNDEIRKHLKKNINESIILQNLCDVAKAVLRVKFIGIQSYLEKQEKH